MMSRAGIADSKVLGAWSAVGDVRGDIGDNLGPFRGKASILSSWTDSVIHRFICMQMLRIRCLKLLSLDSDLFPLANSMLAVSMSLLIWLLSLGTLGRQ